MLFEAAGIRRPSVTSSDGAATAPARRSTARKAPAKRPARKATATRRSSGTRAKKAATGTTPVERDPRQEGGGRHGRDAVITALAKPSLVAAALAASSPVVVETADSATSRAR